MPTSIYTPTSDILTGWTVVGAATHWQCVNTNNGDTSYLRRLYSGIGTYMVGGGFDVPIPSNANIDSVVNQIRGRQSTIPNGESPGNEVYTGIRLSGVNYFDYGNVIVLAHIAYQADGVTWVNDPRTNQPWAPGSLSTINGIGLDKTSNNPSAVGQIRVTYHTLIVNWSLPNFLGNLRSKFKNKTPTGRGYQKSPTGRIYVVED